SHRSWGAGDLGDLDEFARLAGRAGASVVATLPLLAAFGPLEFEASPYRPVSRRFWHERWVDLGRVNGLARSPGAARLLSDVYTAERRGRWVDRGHVDGAAAFAAKRAVIQAWATGEEEFERLIGERVRAWVTENPEVSDYARFRAAGEVYGRDFRSWPSVMRGGLVRWRDVDPSVVRYHLIAQWLVEGQVRDLSRDLAQRGQVLQLDLPVGVHPFGYDVWKDPAEWVSDFSVGAPSDRLAPEGQSWGTPPPNPAAIRDNGHRQLRDALRCHMKVAGLVRLDHVMGLQRLFWVPEGASARDGTYVGMPFAELLAVVGIEAQRHGVDVIGEDLGTVTDELRAAMDREGLRRTYVMQYAIGGEELDDVPPGAVASVATHDTPTFRGWWEGTDLDERERLGQLVGDDARESRAARLADRERLAHALGRPASAGAGEVLASAHAWLAESRAGVVMVQLEEALGETEAVNLPGTGAERANWTQLASRSLEDLAANNDLDRALLPITTRRGPRHGAVSPVTLLSDDDLHLLNQGRHFTLHRHFGAHPMTVEGVEGCYFAVWAPNAARVTVIGDWNGWDGASDELVPRANSGVFEGFVAGASAGQAYKYRVKSRLGGKEVDKADPVAFAAETPPATASRIYESHYQWGDEAWMEGRAASSPRDVAMTVYEVHLGSWRRENGRSLTYLELAEQLPGHVAGLGFTHVELLPVMEHPFYGSWGYQTTGYFAPTARQGSPDEFRALVDALHRAGLGVILDWVPSHFPSDTHGLGLFDGTHLYEHADPRQRVHPDWLSWTFNYGRHEVRSFLTSSATYWVEEFHADGLRVDAVASMLYLDYSRGPGEWTPNRDGGREDLEAIEFLRQLNDHVRGAFPGVVMVAEESTAWPGVTRPSAEGGLGFSLKWDMGWMHDTLDYLGRDPIFRKFHQGELSFRSVYAAHERFVNPLSHDEVVHGKGSLLSRLPGDDWQRFATYRAMLGLQWLTPGKKLVFMGTELAPADEWDHERGLDWGLAHDPSRRGVADWIVALNALYAAHPTMGIDDATWRDFDWMACDDAEASVYVWRRGEGESEVVAVANLTPVPRDGYPVRVPVEGAYRVVANSDDPSYGGSGYPCEP
ncbi:MAG TPA: 1,4-alpha-glucan branching protein GlgB, partial [Acidimicrobiales bacterium]|nr:1,4-alpha-glucan branching protein GlgB [Acidimicrobiales bacterium]